MFVETNGGMTYDSGRSRISVDYMLFYKHIIPLELQSLPTELYAQIMTCL